MFDVKKTLMNVLLFVIIILIIIFLVYFYKNHISDRCGSKRKTLLQRNQPRVNGSFFGGRHYSHKPAVSISATATRVSPPVATVTRSVERDSDPDDDDWHFEDLGGQYNDFVRSRRRAREFGLYGDDVKESIFTKTSSEIINDGIDEEAGTFGNLFHTAKALELRDYIAAQDAESNEYFDPGSIEAAIGIENFNSGQGERSMLHRNEDEATRVVKGQIFNRIREQEGMTIEGLTNRDTTQIQVVPQSMSGGRPPASANLKNLVFQTTNPMAQVFLSSMAAKDIENRKFIAGNSQDSLVDQPYIISENY